MTTIEDLWAQVPEIECKGFCQDSCGPIVMSLTEELKIRQRGVMIPKAVQAAEASVLDHSWRCPALDSEGHCSVYDIRPLICRLWGVVEAMPCPWGCSPKGGWLPEERAHELLGKSLLLMVD